MTRSKVLFAGSLLLFSFLVLSPITVHANIFDDIIRGAKKIIPKDNNEKKDLIVESSISLAPDGDIDKNGEINAGDIVRFTYKITNPTDKNLTFITLNTNIDRKMINFIHNGYGVVNLEDNGKTLKITNIRLIPNQEISFRFDAQVNYFTKEDKVLSTEAEILDKEKKLLKKAIKKQITAKKIDKERIKSKFRTSKSDKTSD